MNKINTIIQAVFGIALIALFVLYFNLKRSLVTSSPIELPSDTSAVEEKNAEVDSILNSSKVLNFPIAYVNVDSIAEHFDYYLEKKKEFEKAMENKSRLLASKEQALSRDINNYQQSINDGTTTLITPSDREKAENALQDRMNKLIEEKQTFENSIMQEDAKLVSEIYKSIDDFLKKYKEELNYSYVLQKGGGVGALLYANENLDITKEVLQALNKEYSSKSK